MNLAMLIGTSLDCRTKVRESYTKTHDSSALKRLTHTALAFLVMSCAHHVLDRLFALNPMGFFSCIVINQSHLGLMKIFQTYMTVCHPLSKRSLWVILIAQLVNYTKKFLLQLANTPKEQLMLEEFFTRNYLLINALCLIRKRSFLGPHLATLLEITLFSLSFINHQYK